MHLKRLLVLLGSSLATGAKTEHEQGRDVKVRVKSLVLRNEDDIDIFQEVSTNRHQARLLKQSSQLTLDFEFFDDSSDPKRRFGKPNVLCDGLLPVHHLCSISADVQIDVLTESGVSAWAGADDYECTTYANAEEDCIVTVTPDGVQGRKLSPKAESEGLSFLVTACDDDDSVQCAYINDLKSLDDCAPEDKPVSRSKTRAESYLRTERDVAESRLALGAQAQYATVQFGDQEKYGSKPEEISRTASQTMAAKNSRNILNERPAAYKRSRGFIGGEAMEDIAYLDKQNVLEPEVGGSRENFRSRLEAKGDLDNDGEGGEKRKVVQKAGYRDPQTLESRLASQLDKDESTTSYTSSSRSRDLYGLSLWEGCFPGMETLATFYIGVSIGSSLFNGPVLSGNVEKAVKWVEALVSDANSIYTQQLRIKLVVRHIEIIKSPGAVPFDNVDCGRSIRAQLTSYVQSSRPSEQGVWNFFDSCFEVGQPVGIAYQGILCTERYNVGVTHLHSVSKSWLTFAHEMGHSFGASHSFERGVGTTGGIMDYGDKTLNGEYQFNRLYREQEICDEVSQSLENCPEFWDKDGSNSICGNGMVEAGEECECKVGQSSCDCCEGCKLKTNAVCDPLHNECCYSNCQFKDTSASCTSSNGPGYCRSGICSDPHCEQYGADGFCGISEANPCRVKCKFSGVCYTMDGWTSDGNPLNHIRSGAYCLLQDGDAGVCQSGSCVST